MNWGLVRIAVKYKVPVIYEHSSYLSKGRLDADIVESEFLKLVVTESEVIKNSLVQSGIAAAKIIVLKLGVNRLFLPRYPEKQDYWRKKLIGSEYKILAVYAGALAHWKGIDMLIDVARKLPHIHFVIAGGNDLALRHYRDLAARLNIKNTDFLGYISHSELAGLYQAADVLLYPHLSGEVSIRTCPLKFFEYLASGTPIAATEISPLLEFKSCNLAIGWCRPDSAEEFARCLTETISEYPRKPEGYSQNLELAKQFTWEERMKKVFQRASLADIA
jgi:glycosyltransferase involved in cell wall biosynthesis